MAPSKKKEVDERSTIQKMFAKGEEFDKETFENFGDVIFWGKLVIGLVCGFVCGFIPVTGVMGFGIFPGITWIVINWYMKSFLAVDEESLPPSKLFFDNLQVSFGGFLLVWIITFTALHGSPQIEA